MKYIKSKRKQDPLESGEKYFTIRYQYNGHKYRVNIGAKSRPKAKEKFVSLHSEDCIIHDCKPLINKD